MTDLLRSRIVVASKHENTEAWITIGSGERRNALTTADWLHLAETARSLAKDPNLRTVVVRGFGANFCAGSDIHEWDDATIDRVGASFDAMETALVAIEDIPVPVVAQISGVAAGAGLQLALACDLRVMGSHARIGMP